MEYIKFLSLPPYVVLASTSTANPKSQTSGMGNSKGKPYLFDGELGVLAGDSEISSEKKRVKEISRNIVSLKGAFGKTIRGKIGQLKDSGEGLAVLRLMHGKVFRCS